MSNSSTYTPTYLYIKKHTTTGMLYFGKTIRDPYKYGGSGWRWRNHINKHGKDLVETIWTKQFVDETELTEFALAFSEIFNIVESDNWANIIAEDGLCGTVKGTRRTTEQRLRMKESQTGKHMSKSMKDKMTRILLGNSRSAQVIYCDGFIFQSRKMASKILLRNPKSITARIKDFPNWFYL